MIAKWTGLLVLASLFGVLMSWAVMTKGFGVLLFVASVFGMTFLVVWAIGAIIWEDWWPFRHL